MDIACSFSPLKTPTKEELSSPLELSMRSGRILSRTTSNSKHRNRTTVSNQKEEPRLEELNGKKVEAANGGESPTCNSAKKKLMFE